jgi:antitoxin (DNA-binding transcriptional repressor) of toxin-antitoxin stability system
MKTVGVRELKTRLSGYLAEVARGEVILVTDRGRVVAELREPVGEGRLGAFERALWPLVRQGQVRLGPDERRVEAYVPVGHHVPATAADRILAEIRGDEG